MQINSQSKQQQNTESLPTCSNTLNKQPYSNLDGYDFIRELGHGSQGDVWLAERKTDKQKVAVKRLNIESVKNWKEYELFKREASVLATLDTDGVAKFYEAVDRLDDNPPCSYIIREYIEGVTLAETIRSGQRFSVNPPDDEKEEDLVHHIYTHLSPENHFKAGDPLPILYRIYKNENNYEIVDRIYKNENNYKIVDSMPYPLPLDDIGELNNAVYHETPSQEA